MLHAILELHLQRSVYANEFTGRFPAKYHIWLPEQVAEGQGVNDGRKKHIIETRSN